MVSIGVRTSWDSMMTRPSFVCVKVKGFALPNRCGVHEGDGSEMMGAPSLGVRTCK